MIGGGPEGSMTARSLADCGHDVLMLEEHASIGEVCGVMREEFGEYSEA